MEAQQGTDRNQRPSHAREQIEAMEPRNGTAAALMAAAVLLASTSPAAAVLSDSHENPFLFTASLRLGMAASFMLITLATFRQKAMRELRSLASNPKTLLTWGPAAALLSTMDYTLYSMSTQHMNPAISVIIMETWPAMIIATATVAHRKSGRYQRLSPSRTAAAMTLATSGVTLVALSQHGDLHSTWQNSHTMATGVLLALAAAATLAPTPITIGWAEQKARKSAQACGENQGNLTLIYVGLVMALASGTGAALHGAASAASGEHFTAGKFSYLCSAASSPKAPGPWPGGPPMPSPTT